MSDGTELCVMPEWKRPESYGEMLTERKADAVAALNEIQGKFALWDSLDQATKDKLDQLTGYKPL